MKRPWMAAGLVALLTLVAIGVGRSQDKAGFGPATIDHEIRAEWQQQGIVPAPPADDARYLRRIYLDITGTLPPPQAVVDFLADRSPDKRARAADALLDSPKYADQWTNYWDNVLMGHQMRAKQVDRYAFRQWLHAQFENDAAWNKFVYDLITASGQNSTGGSYAKTQGFKTAADETGVGDTAQVNGATNWILKYNGKPEDLSGSASKIFLGVQIQCAQCHDHKTEKWKQEDFRRFTACFVNTRPRPIDAMADRKGITRIVLGDINRPFVPRGKKAGNTAQYAAAQPAALDGTDFSESGNRRQALAAWMTAKENPWFAEAIVNRMWSHFLGRGFVEPVDDFRLSNPAVMPDLLKALADDFVAHDYNVKHLIKTICATQAYQLSSARAPQVDSDNKYWARYRLKSMSPDQLLDSLVQATNLKPVIEREMGSNLDTIKFQMQRQFTFLFDVDEEFEQKDFEGTIPQALLLLNGNITNKAVTQIPGTALAEVLAMPGGDAQKIETLYLRTLSRRPTTAETAKWTSFVNASREVISDGIDSQPAPARGQVRRAQQGGGKINRKGATGPDPLARLGRRGDSSGKTAREQAYEDLFWALLNSSEFIFNH
jgi:hypothetical protein